MKLKKITLKEARERSLIEIGQAFGTNLEHCIYEGILHSKNFKKRAKYYVIKNDMQFEDLSKKFITNSNSIFIVSFYEDVNVLKKKWLLKKIFNPRGI